MIAGTDKHPPFCSTRVDSVSDLMMGLAVVQAPPNLLPDQSDCHQISHALLFSLLVNNYQEISHLCVVWCAWFGSLLLGASQLVIALRLIMSGDVELNPGPLDGESLAV